MLQRLTRRGADPGTDDGTGLAGQLPGTAEQAVEYERAPDVALQVVLVGESDTAQDLLAVTRGQDAACPAAAFASSEPSSSVATYSVASAPSIAT